MNAARVALAMLAVAASSLASAQPIVRLSIPTDDSDPLYIDQGSVVTTGSIVKFDYILDVPILGSQSGTQQAHSYRSNQMLAEIDCSKSMYRILELRAYTGTAGTGRETAFLTMYGTEHAQWTQVDSRKGATFGYLARAVCKTSR